MDDVLATFALLALFLSIVVGVPLFVGTAAVGVAWTMFGPDAACPDPPPCEVCPEPEREAVLLEVSDG